MASNNRVPYTETGLPSLHFVAALLPTSSTDLSSTSSRWVHDPLFAATRA